MDSKYPEPISKGHPAMSARILVAASSAIMLLLGSLHLLYTFRGNKLLPRDPAVQAAMNATQMMITPETTVWRAWIGFNASHSICAIFFGLVFGYFAIAQPEWLFRSLYFQLLGLAVLVGFLVLAKLYWFSVPLIGIGIALGCYLAGLVAVRV
jgi:hypothetical protein